jgi:hypothetical protein
MKEGQFAQENNMGQKRSVKCQVTASYVKELLQASCDIAGRFLEEVAERPVGRPVEYRELLERMRVPLQNEGEDPLPVIRGLALSADKGLVATPGPRYFGFVVGGAQPVSVAADWLTVAWGVSVLRGQTVKENTRAGRVARRTRESG